MQRDRRQFPFPLFFVVPFLILLAVWFANYVREKSRFDAEPVELSHPIIPSVPTGRFIEESPAPLKSVDADHTGLPRLRMRSVPKSRFVEEPLPPLKPVDNLPLVARYQAHRFRVHALPIDFVAYDLNDKGIVVGSVLINRDINNQQAEAAFWQQGQVTTLSSGREPLCRASAINSRNAIAGGVGAFSPQLTGDSGNDIALWHAKKSELFIRRSRIIPDVYHPSLSVLRINRWGQFIGNAGPGTSIDLGTFEGFSGKYGLHSDGAWSFDINNLSFFQDGDKTYLLNTGSVYGLNDLGQVVGYETIEQNVGASGDINGLRRFQRAVLYQGARINTLWEDPQTAVAYAINNRQHVVGVQGDYPVLWDSGITLRLQFLSGTTCGVLRDINDCDQIVGHCGKDSTQRATLWQNGSVWNLNRLLIRSHNITLIDATRINSRGQILASDSNQRWYLLTPTKGNR